MATTIVYKTYAADLPWLAYSLKSVSKFVSGISEILIYYHNECHTAFTKMLSDISLNIPIRTKQVGYDYHGYLKQMVIKASCWMDVSSEYVLFLDSDCILNTPFNPSSMIINEKPMWHVARRTPQNTQNDEFRVWEKAVQGMTGAPMKTYYMANGFPFLVKTITLANASKQFKKDHGVSYDVYCKRELEKKHIYCHHTIRQKFLEMATIFEEFEYFGWYAENFTNDYVFIEGSRNNSPLCQYWPHGGLTPEIIKEIESVLCD